MRGNVPAAVGTGRSSRWERRQDTGAGPDGGPFSTLRCGFGRSSSERPASSQWRSWPAGIALDLKREGRLHDTPALEGGGGLTTDKAVAREHETIALMRTGEGRGKAPMRGWMVERHLRKGPLTAGQREAVKLILSEKDRTVGVQGHAGTGKTTMLERVQSSPSGESRGIGLHRPDYARARNACAPNHGSRWCGAALVETTGAVGAKLCPGRAALSFPIPSRRTTSPRTGVRSGATRCRPALR